MDRRRALKTVAATCIGGGLAGCNGLSDVTDDGTGTDSTDGDGTGTTTTTGSEADYEVGMYTGLYFDPVGLYVEPDETVSFVNVSGYHSATAYHPDNPKVVDRRVPEGTSAWNTGELSEEGAAVTVTFETRGTHDYYCIPHKGVGMVGRIVVGEPGGPATESPNPDAPRGSPLPDSETIVEQESVPYQGPK